MRFIQHLSLVSTLIISLLACDGKDESSSNQPSTMEHTSSEHQHDDMGHAEINPEALASSAKGLVQLEVHWLNDLTAKTFANQAHLHFTDNDGNPVAVEILEFHPMMPAMGHGSDESQLKVELADDMGSQFHVTGLYLSMPGKAGAWQLHIKVKVAGQDDEIMIALPEVL